MRAGRPQEDSLPKISIIIPVHNVEDYLCECLDSVVNQTLDDIEIICVDDFSEDRSLGILREYEANDSRLRVIAYSENKSASQARKDAVLASSGDFVMFVDADDTVELDACEKLLALMEESPVDILQFGAVIRNEANLPSKRVDWMQAFVEPYDGRLAGSEVFEGCFEEKLFSFTLWGKLYAGDLCRKAFARIQEGSFPKAQDKYAFFILAYFARSYRGVPDLVFYSYHFGRGVTGHNILSVQRFERYCSMALVADAVGVFLEEEGAQERYEQAYGTVRNDLLHDCVANWNKHLSAADKAAGFDLMLTYWKGPETIAKVAELNWHDQGHIARLLEGSNAIARSPRPVKVVGTYYHRYANGGVQRVLSILIQLWLDLGYEVVLFTDLPPCPDDYDLPDGVQRVVLPSYFEVDRHNFIDRARKIESFIAEHGIDVMVYHAWVAPVLLWDLLVYRSNSVPVIAHCHNSFSVPARSVRTYFADMPAVYHLVDGVVALSEVDRAYWSNFNPNVVTVVNPLTFGLEEMAMAGLGEKNVLWLARVSDEKRPHDALRIFREVLEEEPDAKLFVVGKSPDEEYMNGLYELCEELGIRRSVVMCGFHKDVQPFYQLASVFPHDVRIRRLSADASESQVGGPAVRDVRPAVSDSDRVEAEASCPLRWVTSTRRPMRWSHCLRTLDYRERMGRDARANVESFADFDFAGNVDASSRASRTPAMDHRARRDVTYHVGDSA